MIYIRRIFNQDLRDGKQIAFPKEPSNLFFSFDYSIPDEPRNITFSYKPNEEVDEILISTRLYAAGSESRIDSQLKVYLKDTLQANVNDILIFKRVNNNYRFQLITQSTPEFEILDLLLGSKNHEIISVQLTDDITDVFTENIIKAKNIIYYGAPGTGKSHKVDLIINGLETKYFERLTFHPEFDNASFVGGYKPISEKNSLGNDIIKYTFIPQAFTNIYKRAWLDKGNQYYLVIEEINRGNCAEIFGEIFQLLDRNSNYTVSPSKELKDFLENENGFKDPNHEGIVNGLKLPPNLSILATMNTSDQSLFPMDSAFKRRWEWEYVPICYDKYDNENKPNNSFEFVIDIQNGKKYSWIKFIEQINLNHIKNNPSLGMDKCIGNYFIKPDNDFTITLKPLVNKVIFYLWNDVFKDEENKVFEDNTSYEDFFPIETKGKIKIEELFNRIDLQPISKEYSLNDDSQVIQIAAEGTSEYENPN